jgi:hypothetical protein
MLADLATSRHRGVRCTAPPDSRLLGGRAVVDHSSGNALSRSRWRSPWRCCPRSATGSSERAIPGPRPRFNIFQAVTWGVLALVLLHMTYVIVITRGAAGASTGHAQHEPAALGVSLAVRGLLGFWSGLAWAPCPCAPQRR